MCSSPLRSCPCTATSAWLSEEDAYAVVAMMLQRAGIELERPLDADLAGELEPRVPEE